MLGNVADVANWIIIARQLGQNLLALGTRRLIALGVGSALTIILMIVAAVQIAKPPNEVLYAGLARQEAGRVSAALKDANIEFDLSADSSTIYVRNGHAPRARMLLAQKGLPNSTTSGYELFDKIGSFGLTSFMQEVTKLRAIEGELARTIQMLDGIRGARVHVVMPERASFRTAQQEPSASVVLQIDGNRDDLPIAAIRHLVASAIPKLSTKNVAVVNSSGALLASSDDSDESGSGSVRRLESDISRNVRRNIFDALTPYLAAENLRVSVTAKVNVDRQEVAEKIFIPNTRVERSVRVTRETTDSQDSPRETPTTVQQNLPRQEPATTNDRKKSEATQRREETTNYEISSRTTSTVTAGYRIENMSIAIALNKLALPEHLRKPEAQAALATHIEELEQLVMSAAGFDKKRGDTVKIVALDMPNITPERAAAESGSALMTYLPTAINAALILIVTLSVLFLGVRPLVKAITAPPQIAAAPPPGAEGGAANEDNPNLLASPSGQPALPNEALRPHASPLIEVRDRLKQVLEDDEDTAVAIMKEWLAQERAA